LTGEPPVSILPNDVTIRNDDGEVLLFSWPEFVSTICEGTSCFICGRSRREVAFNDEHIVPNWVLHVFGLHQKTVTLPNGERTVYGNYTIPCCKPCKEEMARTFEDPMSALIRTGGDAIQDHMVEHGGLLPFTWMALIFLKLHLKDRRLRRHLDHRLGDDPISADYTWEHMHHLHAVARAFHIGAMMRREAVGSLFVFPIDAEPTAFDLMTFTNAQTMLLQLGTTGMIAVFDDACAAMKRVMWIIEKITGPLSPIQARDLAAHFAMANLDLINRPRFWTRIWPDRKDVVIGGTTDSVPHFRPYDQVLFDSLIAAAIPTLPAVHGMEPEQARAALLAGDVNFLLDADGAFIADHAARSGLIAKDEA
jgi:hypothetical protein